MATFSGGPEDNNYFVRSANRSVTIAAGGGFDMLDVDWSDKTVGVRGYFDVRNGAAEVFLDDFVGGNQISAIEIEKLIVAFGSGDDQFTVGGASLAELNGGLGMDIFTGDFRSLSDRIVFGLNETTDAVSVVQGQGTSISNFERVQLFTGAGNDDLTGGSLSDTLSAGNGNNRVAGGAGDDQLLTGSGVNTVLGGEGFDRWSGDYRGAGALTLTQTGAAAYGLSNGSSVAEVENVELLFGAADDRIVIGQGGVRQLSIDADGGTDSAVVDWSAATNSISGSALNPEAGVQLFNGATRELVNLYSIEKLDLTYGSGDDVFYLAQPLTVAVDGGAGADFFYADFSSTPFSLRFSVNAMAAGRAQTIGDATVSNFEQVELRTGSGDDTLSGGSLDDRFFTGAGIDTIRAGGGSDIVYAGGGDDLVDGGGGSDQLFGEAGTDTVSYATARAGVTVDLSVRTAQQTGGSGIDLIDGFEDVVGSAFADTLSGDGRANDLNGGAGDDRLMGAGGDDIVNGALGDDVLFGGVGRDKVYGDEGEDRINGGDGNDELFGSFGNDILIGGDEGDYLDGFDGDDVLRGDAGADFIDGGRGSDQMLGGAGGDRLFAGEGDDRLFGGEGVDLLVGEAGADRFIFADGETGTTAATADVIEDFSSAGRDRLDLRSIDADTSAAGNQAFTFVGAAAFSRTAGELRFERDGTSLFVQGDTDGDGLANFYIRLDELQVIAAGDILV
jgi:Ca2+-binding RTX toxin-like protein